jgi:DNA repair protein RadC
MEEKARKTGISAIAVVPWGTHLCQFYETKQDLIDILVPYFKVGLENNEFCMWITSENLNEEEAKQAMREAMPDFGQYLERGQIEILPYAQWYLKDGVFSRRRILNAWLDKLSQALHNDYDGMRVSSNTSWLTESKWRNFSKYEKEVNNLIGKHRMFAICTYSLSKCGASEIIDVVKNHHSTLIKRKGNWILQEAVESEELASLVTSGCHLTPLQERFSRSGFEGFTDQETIELLLSLVLPHPECKKRAKECIKHFQNLRGFLKASPRELEQAGIAVPCMFCFKLLHELSAEVLREKIIDQPVYKSSEEVFDYLYYSMRDLDKEVFKVIYLNNRAQIIDTADLFEGTLESIPIRPSEIVESAINHHATTLIFAHNHPAGDPTPSRSDKQLTRDLVFAGNILQIKVLDHIIIGGNAYFSFADAGLIRKYEDNFLNLKIRAFFEKSKNYSRERPKVFSLHCN